MSPSPRPSAGGARPAVFPTFGSSAGGGDADGRGPRGSGVSPAELEALKSHAQAAGREAGLREGRAQAMAEWRPRLEALGRALEDAARRLLVARVELAAEVDRQLPGIALALVRKVIHQELSVSETAAQTVIRAISERLAGCGRPVVVRVAPQVSEAVEGWRRSAGADAAGPGVRVDPDPRLASGDWMLETDDGFIDGRVESQLEEAWRLVTELKA